jgi:hypothetical protein
VAVMAPAFPSEEGSAHAGGGAGGGTTGMATVSSSLRKLFRKVDASADGTATQACVRPSVGALLAMGCPPTADELASGLTSTALHCTALHTLSVSQVTWTATSSCSS